MRSSLPGILLRHDVPVRDFVDRCRDQEDPARREAMSAPSAADFDQGFSAAGTSAGLRRVWELAAPDLPPEVQPPSCRSTPSTSPPTRPRRPPKYAGSSGPPGGWC
jgi:hypothetical protein